MELKVYTEDSEGRLKYAGTAKKKGFETFFEIAADTSTMQNGAIQEVSKTLWRHQCSYQASEGIVSMSMFQ